MLKFNLLSRSNRIGVGLPSVFIKEKRSLLVFWKIVSRFWHSEWRLKTSERIEFEWIFNISSWISNLWNLLQISKITLKASRIFSFFYYLLIRIILKNNELSIKLLFLSNSNEWGFSLNTPYVDSWFLRGLDNDLGFSKKIWCFVK